MGRCLGIGFDADVFTWSLDGTAPVTATAALLLGPDAGFRDFTERVGDPVPVVGNDGRTCGAADLVALTIGRIVDRVQGARPSEVVVAHPNTWATYELTELRAALAKSLPTSTNVTLVKRATAIAEASAPAGSTVVVLEIGERQSELSTVVTAEGRPAKVLRSTATEELCAALAGQALLDCVLRQAGAWASRNEDVLRRLAERCRQALTVLAHSAGVAIEVGLPGREQQIRVTRPEFDESIRESVLQAAAAVIEAVRDAHDEGRDVTAIVVSGAMEMPALTDELAHRLPGTALVSSSPDRGAACAAARLLRPPAPHRPAPATARIAPRPSPPRSAAQRPVPQRGISQRPPARRPGGPHPVAASATSWPEPRPRRPGRLRTAVIAGVAAAAAILGGVAVTQVADAPSGHGISIRAGR